MMRAGCLVGVALAVCSLAACGAGGSKASSAAGSSGSSAGPGSSSSSAASNGPARGTAFCVDAKTQVPSSTPQAGVDALNKMAVEAPTAVRADVTAIASAYAALTTAEAAAGSDTAKQAAVQQTATADQTSLAPASARVDAWIKANC